MNKYYGPIKAEIDDKARRVVLSCSRGKQPVTSGTLGAVAAWAIDSLTNAGYQVDTSGISEYLEHTS